MKTRFLLMTLALAGLAGTISAQSFQRQMRIAGRPFGDRFRCTVEVIVDGSAQIEIRGNGATLTNISGQPPQWRRLDCNAPLPANPVDFTFHPVRGRGRQVLIAEARRGAPALIRIDDPAPGAARYIFEITWRRGRDFGAFSFR
ncbi:MAG TPA: hypothetical protein VH639_01795 [Bryobacteraceae bacterium]|jgi:hypothetical protein